MNRNFYLFISLLIYLLIFHANTVYNSQTEVDYFYYVLNRDVLLPMSEKADTIGFWVCLFKNINKDVFINGFHALYESKKISSLSLGLAKEVIPLHSDVFVNSLFLIRYIL